MERAQFVFGCPSDLQGIAGGASLSADFFTQIIENHEMIHRPPGMVANDPVENFQQTQHANAKAGFLEQFALHAFGERFANLQDAAGNGPIPLERRRASANEQGAPAYYHHAAHAHDGAGGVDAISGIHKFTAAIAWRDRYIITGLEMILGEEDVRW